MLVAAITSKAQAKSWNATLKIHSRDIKFKIDTGAQCNVMSRDTFMQASKQPLSRSKARLVAFGGQRITPVGKAVLLCEHKKKFRPIEFEVVDNVSNVLGLGTCEELGLVKRVETLSNDVFSKYTDTFTGLGCISGVTHHIQTDPNHMPVVHPPRKVPVTIRPKVKAELQRMERLGVIERVQEATDWVNSMVTVVKPNGKLRICIDPRDLNKAIKREYYPMRIIEEIASHMPNAKLFSVLDASSGFWKVQLDHTSAKLCTFNTPFGRYMFKRLPFGISSAQDVFQAVMSEMFEDIEGVEVVVDDIIIWGTTQEEHDTTLEKVLQRATERNLKLNKDKSQIRLKQISYIGHVLGEDGIKPDPQKVRAISEMERPNCKEELQRFLGMATYLSKFIPNYSEEAAPLRNLLEKETEWHWEESQEKSFQHLKSMVTNSPVLQFFDPQKSTRISVDASSSGMGAVLLQDQHPIAYASKSLTTSQKNYAQIEKEMLAIVFGCNKFHDYVNGLPNIVVETDHKPLESILQKPLHQAPARLQRMIMSIQKYPITVVYKPGKELFIADTLSRAPLPEEADELEFKEYDINILHTLPVTTPKLDEIKEKTKDDLALRDLTSTVLNGWPADKASALPGARPYWNFRDEITTHHGILFKGARVVIPMTMQQEMLQIIHSSHLGIEKCKRRARDVLYWPGMNAQIEEVVSNCTVCSTYQRSNPKEPLLSHEAPHRPWGKVGADLFELHRKHYLVLVNYYSNFAEVEHLTSTTSEQVITKCKSQFARHGIPDVFISDNGPQFSSEKFRVFAQTYQFRHKTSSPYHPQSNGKAERTVQTVKNLLKKAQEDQKDPYLALLDFRNTPMNEQVGSPAQQLMGRRTKTLLPTSANLLEPKTIKAKSVNRDIGKRQQQKRYFDRHAKPLTPVSVGDDVLVQSDAGWKPVVITGIADAPRSYTLTTREGQTYRRNRKYIRKSHTAHDDSAHDDSDDDDNFPSTTQEATLQSDRNDCGQGTLPAPAATPQLRRSTRNTPRPFSYADPYSLRF